MLKVVRSHCTETWPRCPPLLVTVGDEGVKRGRRTGPSAVSRSVAQRSHTRLYNGSHIFDSYHPPPHGDRGCSRGCRQTCLGYYPVQIQSSVQGQQHGRAACCILSILISADLLYRLAIAHFSTLLDLDCHSMGLAWLESEASRYAPWHRQTRSFFATPSILAIKSAQLWNVAG